MKYVVILGDGMADYPVDELNGKTPLEVANKPSIDALAKKSQVGLINTIPTGLKPGSDVANLSVMGFNPTNCYTGRSPLEAYSIGINMNDTDVAFRANLVTLSDEKEFSEKTMIDYSSGEISTEDANMLIDFLKPHIQNEFLNLYAGTSYRHCLIFKNGSTNVDLTPPHDISDKKITKYLPKGDDSLLLYKLMERSYELLKNHPYNIDRVAKGKNPANCLWFWGAGTKPQLENFSEKYGVKAGVISAVDLIKGIAMCSGMDVIDVENITGTYKTNFCGKAEACLKYLDNGGDFVYIHMEAPDECGHQGDVKNKILSIELIDEKVVKPICEAFERKGEDFRMLIMPDHPTPIKLKTHVSDPVPYVFYDSTKIVSGAETYTENDCGEFSLVSEGWNFMDKFLEK